MKCGGKSSNKMSTFERGRKIINNMQFASNGKLELAILKYQVDGRWGTRTGDLQ